MPGATWAMCFSATASFTAGAVLLGLGGLTLRRVRRPAELPYAMIPALFGVQQLIEGGLWLALADDAQHLTNVLTHSYALFSHVLWPIFVPLAVLLLEPDRRRRTVLAGLAVAGAIARAGLLALILSVAANFVASPSTQSGSAGVIAAGLFVIIAGAQLVLIWLLNHAIDRIWSQAENISLMLELQPAGLIGVDGTGTITLVNSAVERQLGYGRDELIDRPIEQLVPPDARGLHTGLRSKYFEHPEQKMMGVGRDLSAVAKDGSLVPVEIGLNPVVHDGRAGALATIVDISERKELERRAQILAREVGHRARNLLAVVRALAMRKLPREGSAEFIATLETLSRTQEIFEGRTVAPLRAILEGELAGLSSEVTISGCEVLLTPSAGQDFSIVVHELATNALKYGALSVAGGAICVDGHEDQEKMFHFEWTEHGGPPIITPPDRTGFGRKVIEAIAKGLRARLNVAYLREGLRLELVVPMESITNVSEIANLSTKV